MWTFHEDRNLVGLEVLDLANIKNHLWSKIPTQKDHSPYQAWEMNQTMVFSRDIICEFELILLPKKRKPENMIACAIQTKVKESERYP